MSLFGLFDIGRSAVLTSQTALSVVGNNIANVNTPGFSRQEVILDIANPVSSPGGLIGAGVTVAGIRRSYDKFIQYQIVGQQQNCGRSLALSDLLGGVEQVFNEAAGRGIASSLSDFFNAWNDLASAPEDLSRRIVLLQKAGTLTDVAKQMEGELLSSLKEINGKISDSADRINTIASEIAALNGQIVCEEAGLTSEKALGLRDQRDSLVSELAGLSGISFSEDTSGALTISMGMRTLVSGDKANVLAVRTDQDGDSELFLDDVNITDDIGKGQIGGLIAARSDIETHALHDLRKLVASLTLEVNAIHSSGYGLDASTGNNLFTPLSLSVGDFSAGADMNASIADPSALTLDEYDVTFDSAGNYTVTDRQTGAAVASGVYVSGDAITFNGIRLVISGDVGPNDRFSVSPLTDAISNFGAAFTDPDKVAASASDTTLPGDNTVALSIARLSDAGVSGLGGSTFMDYYEGIVSAAGTKSRAASDSLAFDQSLLSEITDKQASVSGVSLDEEAANLVKFQRSYEAGAKMITVADELIKSILNLQGQTVA